jgi:hypothetical protein
LAAVAVGAAAAFATSTPDAGVIAAATSAASPAYPPPVLAAPGGALKYCPSAAGLEQFGAGPEAAARSVALDYGHVDEAEDLAHSDRAWQPTVRAMWSQSHGAAPGQTGTTVYEVSPANRNGYRVIVRRSCGAPIVGESLAVTVVPHRIVRPNAGTARSRSSWSTGAGTR